MRTHRDLIWLMFHQYHLMVVVVPRLYGNTVPKTVDNFRSLCTGEKGVVRPRPSLALVRHCHAPGPLRCHFLNVTHARPAAAPTLPTLQGKSGKPLHYKGSKFHRVIPQFMLQASRATAAQPHPLP